MIDLYTWATPNGRKISILLEELGAEYSVHPIDITEGEQHDPAFLEISPNNTIPAIVDRENGIHMMQSGAIMLYLAEKHGRFMPGETGQRREAMEWLMWHMGDQAPILGQCHHFLRFNPGKSAYAEERFHGEAKRLYGVLDGRLEGRDYIVDEYSIIDMAVWPWVSRYEWHQIDLRDYPRVRAWYRHILARDAVQRGYQVPEDMGTIPPG